MEPESFFHVAVKTDDVDASEAFYRDHFDAEVVERGEGATAVTHVALDVADKLVYLFEEAPTKRPDSSIRSRPGFSTSGTSFRTSTPRTDS